MQNSRKFRCCRKFCQLVSISLFLFLASPSQTWAYGGYHYGYHHEYGHHGGIGTAGYVVLGILGAVLLSHILNDDNYRHERYRKADVYQKPKTYHSPSPAYPSSYPRNIAEPVYSYNKNEGWHSLARGNAKHALDIFAIQSQQDLNSGIPKVGFSIAAAANGEMDRGIRAMRKAIKIDPESLNNITINKDLETKIDFLNEEYKSILKNKDAQADQSFMIAALSYLQQDYTTAKNILKENDQNQSTNNLRALLNNKE